MKNQIVEAKVKAFSGQGVRSHKLAVDGNGTVRVWDDVAGYYTTVHSMSHGAQSRIRKIASAQ